MILYQNGSPRKNKLYLLEVLSHLMSYGLHKKVTHEDAAISESMGMLGWLGSLFLVCLGTFGHDTLYRSWAQALLDTPTWCLVASDNIYRNGPNVMKCRQIEALSLSLSLSVFIHHMICGSTPRLNSGT